MTGKKIEKTSGEKNVLKPRRDPRRVDFEFYSAFRARKMAEIASAATNGGSNGKERENLQLNGKKKKEGEGEIDQRLDRFLLPYFPIFLPPR